MAVACWRVREEVRPEVGGSVAAMVESGETTGGLEAEPGGAPVFTAALSAPTSGPAVESRVEVGPTNLVGAPRCSVRDPSRWKSVAGDEAKRLDGWHGS